jgi:hypothetical protein
MLVSKVNTDQEENKRDELLYHYHNQCIHVTDGVTVLSLSAGLLQKIIAATDYLCQIVLNRPLLRKFESCVNLCVKAEQCKKKLCKMRSVCN